MGLSALVGIYNKSTIMSSTFWSKKNLVRCACPLVFCPRIILDIWYGVADYCYKVGSCG